MVLKRIMLSHQTVKDNIASCSLYAKSKKYNKLVNVPKISRFMDIENSPVITNGEGQNKGGRKAGTNYWV